MNKETNIDCMKYRKSTHLAGIDVEAIIAEKGECILTISQAYYAKGVDVSGKKTDGYFIHFSQDEKPMVVNSGNRSIISSIVKNKTKCTSIESRNIGNWVGLTISLYFDPTVKMMGQFVGGIKVNPISPIPDISDENALNIIGNSKTIDELKANWDKISKDEKALPSVVALKDKIKSELS